MIYKCRCGASLLPGADECPECGNVFTVKDKSLPPRTIEPDPNDWREKAIWHEIEYWRVHGIKGYDGFKQRVMQLNLGWGQLLIRRWRLED
jgi:hypothetical protein